MHRSALLRTTCALVTACATVAPAPKPRELEMRKGATLMDEAPVSTDIEIEKAAADLKENVIELSSPLAGGFTMTIRLKSPNPGMSYEIGAGHAFGECEVNGKTVPLDGVVRLDEWTKTDNIASVSVDVWCKPEGFEQPRRARVAFTQKHPGQATMGDDVQP